LSNEHGLKSTVDSVLVLADIGVLMESITLRSRESRQGFDVIEVAIIFSVGRREVDTKIREFVVLILVNFFAIEFLENGHHGDSVHLFSYTTSIVALTSKIVEGIKWNFVGIRVDENLQLLSRDSEIRLVELIRLVPSKRTE
jgi:hypothetical protein